MCRQVILVAIAGIVLGIAGAAYADDPTLIGWWKLDDGDGETVLDSSGRGVDGTIVNLTGGKGTNGAVWIQDAERGTVLSFNGDDTNGAYVTAGTVPALDLVNDFTWMVWCKQTASGTGDNDVMLGNRYGGTSSPLQFVKFTATKFEYYNNDSSYTDSITYPTRIPDEVWVHNVIVKKGATLTYYRNGKKVISSTLTKTMDANPFYMGGDPQGERWAGCLSDVRLYERAVTEEEIYQLGATLKASKPNPADGTLNFNAGVPLLQWTAGDTAIYHTVYLGSSPDLTEADIKSNAQRQVFYYHVLGVTPGAMYYWRVDEIEKDTVTTYPGDVWSFLVQDVVAYYPTPVDGATATVLAPTLTWLPGTGALGHHVYFSDDPTAVAEGAASADQGTVGINDPNFVPGTLDTLATYYWRVDETLLGNVVKTGAVWSFSTCLPIDDFESYTDDEGSRIYETWLDGYADSSNGSIVGNFNAPFAEQVIVHSGAQAMPIDYNNIESPYYSEANYVFDSAQDWTDGEPSALVLWIRGRAANSVEPLYVALEDSSKHIATVVHSDESILTTTEYSEWKIPLSDFAGVTLSRIKTIYIGVGDKANPQAGGTGRVFVDDICLSL